ncbi:unnamed protein product, partial [Amoebophrya sp. A120]
LSTIVPANKADSDIAPEGNTSPTAELHEDDPLRQTLATITQRWPQAQHVALDGLDDSDKRKLFSSFLPADAPASPEVLDRIVQKQDAGVALYLRIVAQVWRLSSFDSDFGRTEDSLPGTISALFHKILVQLDAEAKGKSEKETLPLSLALGAVFATEGGLTTQQQANFSEVAEKTITDTTALL